MSFILEKLRKLREQKVRVYSYSYQSVLGERPSFNFDEAERIYRNNGVVRAAIDMLTEMVMSGGFYIECEDEKALEALNSFAADVNLDMKVREVISFLFIYGNAFMEKVFDGKKIVNVKVWAPQGFKVIRDPYGDVTSYEYWKNGRKIATLSPEEVIHFRLNRVGNGVFGVGLIESNYQLLKIQEEMVECLPKLLRRYSDPRKVWLLPARMSDTDLQQFIDSLENVKPGEDIFLKGEADIKILEPSREVRFNPYFDWINNQILEGLGAPLLSLLKNSTEASARTQLEAVERKVESIQRYVKRKIEKELLTPLLETLGFKNVEARVRWGIPRTVLDEISVDELANLARVFYEVGIDTDYIKGLLVRKGFPPFEERKTEEMIKEGTIPDLETDILTLEQRLYGKLRPLFRKMKRKREEQEDEEKEAIALLQDYYTRVIIIGIWQATRETGKVSFAFDKEDIDLINEYRNIAYTRVKDLSSKVLTINYRELDRRVKLLVWTIWEPYNKARNNVFVRRDVLIRWNAMRDKRTCADCWNLHGRVWKATEPHPVPPLHVQCRCYLQVYRE